MMKNNVCGAASIGMIGGADGPTAIYLTEKPRAPYVSRGMRRLLAGASLVTAALIAVVRLAGARRRRVQ